MNKYESMFIVRDGLNEEEREASIEKIKNLINSKGGELTSFESWGKRKLAYVIDKVHKEGEYFLMYFMGNEDVLNELDHIYRISDDIIRYLVIRLEK